MNPHVPWWQDQYFLFVASIGYDPTELEVLEPVMQRVDE